jgi:type II secretory pathway pseudopilin PulG
MKTSLNKQRLSRGNTLLITLFVTAIIGIVLASYLTLVRNQNYLTMRSQAWNSAITVIEAGLEEALTHLDRHGTTNLLTDGWTLSGGLYTMTRSIDDTYYVVTISSDLNPTIVSSGYVPLPSYASVNQNSVFAVVGAVNTDTPYANRAVRVTTRRNGTFTKAMVAKLTIDMNGNNIESDSFDSTKPAYSTGGQYDVTKRRDNGDVASNDTILNSINVMNADIRGRVSTGPHGTVNIGPNGSVGNSSWVDAGNNGIQPGYFTDDMNVTFDDVSAPFNGGAFSPSSGNYGGDSYTYVLGTDNYQMSDLSMNGQKKMIVTGNAVLYVTGDASLSGNAYIKIAPGATLKMYVGGSASLNGNGIINQSQYATNFCYYGLPSNTSLSLSGNGTFKGVIYAPSAAFTLNGGGSGTEDFIGASVTKTVTMNGHFKFHYDEALIGFGGGGKFIVTSWDEI